MAHRHRPFYNLDKPVGRNKANARDDVMLVQWFLSRCATKNNIFGWKPPSQALAVNGSFDSNLEAWILSFQTALKSSGTPVHPDGIVDPAQDAATRRSTITHSIYTIVLLNNLYESLFPDSWNNLPRDLQVPGELRTALSRDV